MPLFIASLNSGSNANCYYVGNHQEAVLVDVGLSCRETEKRMKQLGLSMQKIKAIFISHEHSDHIKGVPVLAGKYQLPIFVSQKTAPHLPKFVAHLITHFSSENVVEIGALSITAFTKFHDAVEPHSFIIEHQQTTVGVFTDIGNVCKNVVHYFKQCHAVFLESNYDEDMLQNGNYPFHLKKRISSNEGHLSNLQALELFKNHRHKNLSHLLLSHLSKENNSPEKVLETFMPYANGTKIMVASRYGPSEIFTIAANEKTETKKPAKPVQMRLWG